MIAWDLDLCMHWDNKVLVPFHYLVKPRLQISRTELSQTFDFPRLPTDIQSIIYKHCDLPRLFQLMPTCSRTRGPAAKLFWTNPPENHWYYSPDNALFTYQGSNLHSQQSKEAKARQKRLNSSGTSDQSNFGHEKDHINKHVAPSTSSSACW
jgi:hypothetical protein